MLLSCGDDTDTISVQQIALDTNMDLRAISAYQDQLVVVGGQVFEAAVALSGKEDDWVEWTLDDKMLFGIDCNEEHCLAVGQDGYYYRYTQTDLWQFYRLAYWDFQRAIALAHGYSVTVSGKSYTQGAIYHIAAAHKIDTLLRYEAEMADVVHLIEDIFVAVGYGQVLRSTDGGYSWQYAPIEGDFYTGVDFIDADHGIAVGLSGSIIRTTDGGQHWETVKQPSAFSSDRDAFTQVRYINDQRVFICGDDGLLWESNDGGLIWQSYKIDVDITLHDLEALGDYLYLVGDHGYMATYTL